VWISAADAQARGISPRDKVKVYNDRGAVYASANVTNRLVPGVAILHQGSWYEPGPDGIDAGGCANTLTSEKPSRISHGNSQMTLLVQIAKA
jgi:anaerobic dimethyl sulfoxide reductase subunit A